MFRHLSQSSFERGAFHVQVFIIEANPRASRTVPFVAKAIGHPIAKYASLLMSGKTLAELKFTEEPKLNHVAVKEAVLPFDKFPGVFLPLTCINQQIYQAHFEGLIGQFAGSHSLIEGIQMMSSHQPY